MGNCQTVDATVAATPATTGNMKRPEGIVYGGLSSMMTTASSKLSSRQEMLVTDRSREDDDEDEDDDNDHDQDHDNDHEQKETQGQQESSSLPKPHTALSNTSKQDPYKLGRSSPHDELGAIHYQFGSLEEAQREARRRDEQPILCFEIDIPGDERIGLEVFTHPLVVEAAESLFVTARLRSNAPSTTVRVLDAQGNEVVASLSGDHLTVASLSTAMIQGLKACGKQPPPYLCLLAEEENGKIDRTTLGGAIYRVDRRGVFGVSDARLGEVEFGGLDGVLGTKTGHIQSQHVVQITYDSSRLSFGNLVRFALQRKLADVVYYSTHEERTAGVVEMQRVKRRAPELVPFSSATVQPSVDPKYALRQTMLRFVPMTDLQATRVNRLVHMGVFHEGMRLLSPRQGMILMRSMHCSSARENMNEVVDVPITRAWKRLSEAST